MAENTFAPYAYMTIPQRFVSRPFETKPNDQGKVYAKAIVTMPEGVSVNGIDLSGYKASLFMSDRAMQQKEAGEPCTFSMNPDREIQFWKDRSDGTRSELHVRPRDIAKAVKAQREAYVSGLIRERSESEDAEQRERDFAEPPSCDMEEAGSTDACDEEGFDPEAVQQETVEQIIAAARMSAACYAEMRRAAAWATADTPFNLPWRVGGSGIYA